MTPKEKTAKKGKAPPSSAGKGKKKVSIQKRANVIFPITKIKKHAKKEYLHGKCSVKAAVALAAGIEYIVSELLTITVERDLEDPKKNKKTITPRHLKMTIDGDEELADFFKDSNIRSGGVHEGFLKKPKQPKQIK